MNFGQMKEIVPAMVAGPSQAQRLLDISPTFVGAMLNEAYHKVERAALWKWSEAEAVLTVVSGSQSPSSQPVDMAIPFMARNINTRADLVFHDERQRFAHDDDPAASAGRISRYGIFSGDLRFFPPASQTEQVRLRYYRTWPDMVLDADEPEFPETWHDLLTSYAAGKTALRLQPVAGKFLPESAARPFLESWEQGLYAMTQSDRALTTWDKVENHDLTESMWRGESVDW